MTSRVWVVLLALAGLLGCATTDAPAAVNLGPEPALLEVINRTDVARTIAVDGHDVGTAPPGSRARFRHLRPGRVRIDARALGQSRIETRLDLRSGERAEWAILPEDAMKVLEAPAPLGAARLDNASDHDLEVKVNDGEWHALPRRSEQLEPDLAPGDHVVHLRIPSSRHERSVPFVVRSLDEARVRLEIETMAVELRNGPSEPVIVTLDGLRLWVLAPSDVRRIALVEGLHTVVVRGQSSGRERSRSLRSTPGSGDPRAPDGDADVVWDLAVREATFLVDNHSRFDLQVSVNGVEKGDVSAGSRARIDGVDAGRIEAVATAGKTRYATALELAAGQTQTWTISAERGAARVDNTLFEPVEVAVDDVPTTTIAAGGSAFLTDLVRGPRRLVARGAQSGRVIATSVDVDPAQANVVTLSGAAGRLRVQSALPDLAWISAAGRTLGTVPAGGDVTFLDAPVGEHRVVARASSVRSPGGDRIEDTLILEADRTTLWELTAATASLTVKNLTPEVLRTPPTFRSERELLEPGQSVTAVVGVGNRVFRFVGETSSEVYPIERRFERGQHLDVDLLPLEAAVHVMNRSAEPVTLTVDGAVAGIIVQGGEASHRLMAGRHRLHAIGTLTQSARELVTRFAPGAAVPWELLPPVGHVRIENRTPEPLSIELDGQPLARLEAGTVGTYGPYGVPVLASTDDASKEGTLKVFRAIGLRSGARYRAALAVTAGAMEVWAVLPARGQLVIDNRRDEGVVVLVDGVERARVAPGEEKRIDAETGRTIVDLVGETTKTLFRSELAVRPDREHAIVAPAGPHAVVVDNHTSETLEIRVDETVLGRVDARSTTTLPLPKRAAKTILAREVNGARTYTRRLAAPEDRITRWEIWP
ncbi:MAG: hypothetical protein IV100_02230 [Myxococcales bacterium]|nr:hypothetical protein [Myxococcales bacterium]